MSDFENPSGRIPRFRRRRRRFQGGPAAPGGQRGFPLYILPNLFTTANIFCGFFSVLKSFQGDFLHAAYFILGAALFDLVDGRVARMTHTSSQFGMEYDSLSDVISFGVAPALLMYFWSLKPFGRLGWLVAFLYLACGALRLARFNTQAVAGQNEKGYFRGLPIPIAALVVATSVLFHEELQLTANRSLYMLITTFLTAYLMVSTVRFRSFKDFDIRSHHAFSKLVIAVVIAIAIASNPDINLFLAVVTFIGLNLIVHVFRSLFRRRRDDPNAAPRGTESPKGTA